MKITRRTYERNVGLPATNFEMLSEYCRKADASRPAYDVRDLQKINHFAYPLHQGEDSRDRPTKICPWKKTCSL